MAKYEKILISESCPNCGDSLIVSTDCAEEDDTELGQLVYDGDEVRCAADCGFMSCVIADENGAWVEDGNIEDLIK